MITDIHVSIAASGGGLIAAVKLEEFLERFRPAPAETTPYYLEYFCFDDCPWVLGFTDGKRWNGWGRPRVEKSCVEAYIKLVPEMFEFTPEGNVHCTGCWHDEDEPPVIAKPEIINWKGKEITVFDLGDWGLTWNNAPMDTEAGDADDDLSICRAIIPDGWDRAMLGGIDG